MSRVSYFDSPLLLGFDQVERILDRVTRSANDGYPPYNIERVDDRTLRITLAVAGFDDSALSVSVEESQLVIRGRKPEEEEEREYLHRGIATRQFQRSFVLADGIEVSSAHLDKGLLSIELQRPVPETIVRKIDISTGDQSSSAQRKVGRSKASSKTVVEVVDS